MNAHIIGRIEELIDLCPPDQLDILLEFLVPQAIFLGATEDELKRIETRAKRKRKAAKETREQYTRLLGELIKMTLLKTTSGDGS